MSREPAAVLLSWWFIVSVAATISTTASIITILSDGNRTDCSSNSSGTFCYSLSYALNHVGANNTVIFIASPEVGLHESAIVKNFSNISVHGQGIDKTVICFYYSEISFMNVSGLQLSNLTIQPCKAMRYKGAMPYKGAMHHYKQFFAVYIRNCSNVEIDRINISKLTVGALALYYSAGYVRISNSMFKENLSPAGNLVVYNKNYAGSPKNILYITIHACVFIGNSNQYRNSISGTISGHGGGLLLQFDYAYWTMTKIHKCHFINNSANYGGALHVSYRRGAENNKLYIENTMFASNTAQQGGGGMTFGLSNFSHCISKNNISIKNVVFHNNSAWFGGGAAIFSEKRAQCNHLRNRLEFHSCKWVNNTAHFGTAVDISPSVYDNVVDDFSLLTRFQNCTFTRNRNRTDTKNTRSYFHSGTVMITVLAVRFSGYTEFSDNDGTALHIVAAKVTFSTKSLVKFENNSAIKGGALALVAMATLQFGSHSTFLFQNNKADFVGGAIYWYSVDEHDYFSSRTCFLRSDSKKTKNVTFTFINNTAHTGIGASVYATTLFPCMKDFLGYSKNLSLMEILGVCKHANFTFLNHSNVDYVIATSGHNISLPRSDIPLKISPGIATNLDATVYDEGGQNVTPISVFQNSILPGSNSGITLSRLYELSSISELMVYGSPGNKAQLLVQTNGIQSLSTIVDIEIVECAPGLVLNGSKCECVLDQYSGIECVYSHAYIHEGYWAGYLLANNTTIATPDNLWTSLCPLKFCNYHRREGSNNPNKARKLFPLPNSANASNLADFMCDEHRTGVVCGQCKDNFSVFFHSKLYSCKQVSYLCNVGVVFYVLSELIPLAILFTVILTVDVSFTSGAINGFILFTQIVDLIDSELNFYRSRSWSVSIYQFVYGFFNLDFFGIEELSFCLWQGATVLDVLVFKYITTVFAILLMFGLVVLMNNYLCLKICKCCRKKGFYVSMIQGLSAFLVMAYSQCTRVTFEILQPALLQDRSANHSKYVVRLDGSKDYFGPQHLYYALPALVFLVCIVILPPSFLIINPVLVKIFAFFQYRNYCSSSRSRHWLNKILLVQLKPLFDSFQGCFKDNCRHFSGVYFVYRLSILLIRIFSPSLGTFYIVTEFALVSFLVFHSSVYPYQKRWHNVLDMIIFGNLAVINGFSLIVYFQSTTHGVQIVSTTMIQKVQLFLIYWPMLYILIYTIIVCSRRHRVNTNTVSKIMTHFSSSPSDSPEDDVPARLLLSNSDS